jgi:hypothetical protein
VPEVRRKELSQRDPVKSIQMLQKCMSVFKLLGMGGGLGHSGKGSRDVL